MANDVFAGRRGFLRCFRESLFALATDQKESKGFKGKRQKDFQVSFPQLFMVCGEAGWGKSALVRRCIALAAEVEAETKKEFKTIVVDFDDPLFTRNILPFTPRMMVQYLHAVLVDPSLNLEDCFSEYASVEQRLEKVIAGVNALHRDEWLSATDNDEPVDFTEGPAQKAALHTADAVNGASPHARTARQEAEAAFLRWLREKKRLPEEDCDLFENADFRLTKALVSGLQALSADRPVVLAIDNLERVANPLVVEWLRTVFFGQLFEKKNRVAAVVSCRDNLLRFYRNFFPEEVLSAVSLDDLPLCRLDIDECNEALRLGLSAETVAAVEEATGGVAMVVRDLFTYAKSGTVPADMLDAAGNAETMRDKMTTVVARFLAAQTDERTKARVVHLAMLGRADAGLLAALWNVSASETGAEMLRLSEKFPFIEEKAMHNGVSLLFRGHLIGWLAKASSPYAGVIKEFGQAAVAYYNDQLSQLVTAIPAPDKRFVDDRFEEALLGSIRTLLWHDHAKLKSVIPGTFLECLLYNQVLAGRILAAAEEFAAALKPDLAGLFNILSSGLLAAEGQPLFGGEKPAPAELSMLSALEIAAGTLTPQQQAILRLRAASCACRALDYQRALDELEKCEHFADESDLFCQALVEGYCGAGSAFYAAEKYEMSTKAFGKAAEIRPGLFDAWYCLGSSYAALKRHAQAEDSFTKAAACRPESFEAHNALATERFAQKKYGDAAASYAKAAGLNPGAAETWHMLGLSHAALSRSAEAVEAYRKAIAISAGDAALWFDLAESQGAVGSAGDSIASCRKALELNPSLQKAAVLLGRQLSAAGNFPEAAKAFETAARLSPKDETVWYSLGCAQLESGDAKKAVQSFAKATDINKDFADAHNKSGLALFREKDLDGAVAAYKKAVKADPAHFEAYLNLGSAHVARKELEKALTAFTKAADIKPDLDAAWYNAGLVCSDLGRFGDALEPLSKAAALSPAKQEIWTAKGLALGKLDKNEEAAGCFAKAAELSPQSFDAWYRLGCALESSTKYGEAVDAFAKASGLSPRSADAWHHLGLAHAALGQHDRATAAFGKAVAIDPTAGETWHLLGVSHQQDGRFDEAVRAFREAAKLLPGKQESWHGAGLCSYYLKKYDDAIELLSKAKDLSPDTKDTLYTLALSFHAKSDYAQAAALYRRTLELAPAMANARMNLALSLHALKQYGEAVAVYRKIAEEQPANADVWYNMGLACEAQGGSEEAVAAYAKAAELAPDKIAAWTGMGTIQVSLERYADAIASFTKAVGLQSDNADAWANIARASYYIGRFDDAVAAYAKVNGLRPGDASAWGGLGLTYYTMGNYPKAIEASEKALAIKPDELWIQVNLALAAVMALNLDKAKSAFGKIIDLAKTPNDLLHPIANLKELVARNPNLGPAREILAKLEEAWRKLKK
jgi:tetratricopeptide (TPR) repeat protein